jgi:hypothetical protein
MKCGEEKDRERKKERMRGKETNSEYLEWGSE